MRLWICGLAAAVVGLAAISPATAEPFFFSTNGPDAKMAMASRPNSPGKIEIETGDDFVLTKKTAIDSATFTGLITDGVPLSSIGPVHIEIYQKSTGTALVPTVEAWKLPSEPWLFGIDATGTVQSRIDGAFGGTEMKALLDALVQPSS